MKKINILCLFTFSFTSLKANYVVGGGFDDGDNDLGSRISAHIQANLAGLDGLGDRINEQVQNNLNSAFRKTLGSQPPLIFPGVQSQPLGFQPDLGARIDEQVQRQVAPLQGLGSRIQAQVEKGLEPVRAMESYNKMKNGIGGVTLAEHSPSGTVFIIRDNNMNYCRGRVDWNQGVCLGTQEPFTIAHTTDWCFAQATSRAKFNDVICLSTGSLSVSSFNNVVECKSNGPIFKGTVEDYRRMCQDQSQSVRYKYFANPGSLIAVKIPNQNPYVSCTNREENVCEFTENNPV